MSALFMKNFNDEYIFCLEYDKETLRDMVIAKQKENDKLKEDIIYLKNLLDSLGVKYDL